MVIAEQSLSEVNSKQLAAGRIWRNGRKKYRGCDGRILHIINVPTNKAIIKLILLSILF